MNAPALVSVVIPVYNAPVEMFSSCLQSVLSQTQPAFEVIVVDDGSRPELAKRYRDICEKYTQVVFTAQTNCGASAARNAGTRFARGDYVAYVDADDLVQPWYLAEALDSIRAHELDFAIGGCCHEPFRAVQAHGLPETEIFTGDMTPIVRHFQEEGALVIKGPEGWAMGSGPGARLLRADIAKRCAFPENVPLNEDTLWNMDVLHVCKRVGVVKSIWYTIRDTRGSVTKQYRPNCVTETETQLAMVRRALDAHYPAAIGAYYARVTQDFGRVMHLGVMHKLHSLTAWEQYRTVKRLLTREPWKEAFAKVDIQLLNRNRKLLVALARLRLYGAVWMISRLRVKQLEGRYGTEN